MVLYDQAQPDTSVQTLYGPEVISGTEGTFFRGSSGTPIQDPHGGMEWEVLGSIISVFGAYQYHLYNIHVFSD